MNTPMHTPEPWAVAPEGRFQKVEGNGYPVAEMWLSDGNHKANARRIVACVNACAGLPTEELENVKQIDIASTRKQMREQRDELANLLREVIGITPPNTSWEERAKTALAKVSE